MLRIAAILAAVAAFPAVALAARQTDAPATPSLITKVVACDVVSDNRAAVFYARMDTIPGAAKMQMRFQLLERLGSDSSWNKIDVPALRQWHAAQPGVKRFGWKQTVDALRIGGAYKARVQFRWLNASGAALDSETRDTPVCRGPLPNLSVGNLQVKPGPTPDTETYRVDVSNTGKADAAGVDVSLSVDRALLDTVTLDQLAAGETKTVTFTGPVCHRAVRAKADPDNTIGESVETDNSQLFACS